MLSNNKNLPNFAAWREDNLAKIAEDLYMQNLQLREANEQLRLDLKDAMKLVRATSLTSIQEFAERIVDPNSLEIHR